MIEIQRSKNVSTEGVALLSQSLMGEELSVGTGFEARSFRAVDIGKVMDPLVMVDHYVMSAPTFGAHPHAGLSAVSLLFEDSQGLFRNRDSLGNDFNLQPGDMYWLKAGRGAVHDEYPLADARIHGLQVFINMPHSQRLEEAESLLVRAKDMPVLETEQYRVKLVLGESNGILGAVSPSIQMTILDGVVQPGGCFVHRSASNRSFWIHAIEGTLDVVIDGETRSLIQGQAIAIHTDLGSEIALSNTTTKAAHFALFDGEPIAEPYVHEGPFVMDSEEQIADVKAAYKKGRLGALTDKS